MNEPSNTLSSEELLRRLTELRSYINSAWLLLRRDSEKLQEIRDQERLLEEEIASKIIRDHTKTITGYSLNE